MAQASLSYPSYLYSLEKNHRFNIIGFMESLRELYRIGQGPSSSHTMGPRKAAEDFIGRHPEVKSVRAELYGSLAATGKGHLTDKAIREAFKAAGVETEIFWFPDVFRSFHPNCLSLISSDGSVSETYYSVGGGKIVREGDSSSGADEVYPNELVGSMKKLLAFADSEGYQLWEVALRFEKDDICSYMEEIWQVMKDAIKRGLENEGVLPGGLKLPRKACLVHEQAISMSGALGNTLVAHSYALAVSEENAAGGIIVTAPTCGSCGVLPGALYYIMKEYDIPEKRVIRALLTAGLVGNIVKTNGSISGAEVGCQGEVGVACAMAGAAVAQLLGGTIRQVEYAAEMGLEHHLGLTCDPLKGLVQIPCIERNGFACMRAVDHASFALVGDGTHKISFDDVVEVMMETGHALPSLYRETSMGGLARVWGN